MNCPSVRRFIPAAALLLTGTLLLSGCKKDDSSPSGTGTSPTSESDAGNVVAGAIGGGDATGGMAAQVGEATSIAMGLGLPPSPSLGKVAIDSLRHDTTVVRQFAGTLRQYSYTFAYSWQFSNAYGQLSFGYNMSGGYSTPVIAGLDSAHGDYLITRISGPDTMLTFQGTYTRLGFQTLKTSNGTRIYSGTQITFAGLSVSKRGGAIFAGTANVTVGGYEERTGAKFLYTCTLTFIGTQQARMVVNGKTFIIDLTTGTATPA